MNNLTPFYVNNLRASIKHWVYNYSNKNKASLVLQSSWTNTVHILQTIDLFGSLSKSFYKQGDQFLFANIIFIFWQIFSSFLSSYWLFWFQVWLYLFMFDLIFANFSFLFLILLQIFFVRCISNDFKLSLFWFARLANLGTFR